MLTPKQEHDLRDLCERCDVDYDNVSASGDLLTALEIIGDVQAVRACQGVRIYQNNA